MDGVFADLSPQLVRGSVLLVHYERSHLANSLESLIFSSAILKVHANFTARGGPIDGVATWKTRLWTAVAGLQRRARNRRAYSEQQQKPRAAPHSPNALL